MRLLEHEWAKQDWLAFFDQLRDDGIDWLHSSNEYESFDLLKDTLTQGARRFRHVVKLGEPSFDEGDFLSSRLERKVDDYLRALHLESIDIVQWMWRDGLNTPHRLERFLAQADAVSDGMARLVDAGKVQAFTCFPYDPAFARGALEVGVTDSLAVYRNPEETDYDAVLMGCAPGRSVAIRPFAAGAAFARGASCRALLDHAASPSAIGYVVATATKLAHYKELAEYVAQDGG